MKTLRAWSALGVVIIFLAGCAHQSSPRRLSMLSKYVPESTQAQVEAEEYLRSRFCQELLMRFGISPYSDSESTDAMNACVSDSGGNSYPRDSFSIALSGGGTRSASFAMGVLKALNDDGLLEQADAISSVSGGGYTSYWLASQRFYSSMVGEKGIPLNREYYRTVLGTMAGKDNEEDIADLPFCQHLASGAVADQLDVMFRARIDGDILLRDTHQRHIAAQSDIMNYTQNPSFQKLESAAFLGVHIASLPLYWVTDGVLNTGFYNGSVFTNAYRKGLERTYGLSPNLQHDNYVDFAEHKTEQFDNARNGKFLFWRGAARTEEVQFKQLREFSLAYNTCARALAQQRVQLAPMSMPIINAKLNRPDSWIRDDESFDMGSLEKSVFTFTPLQWGSAHTDYHVEQVLWAPIPFSKSIAVSGAALDEGARQASGIVDTGLSLVNANLGYDIRNPKSQKSWRGSIWFYTYKLIGGFPLRWVVPEKAQASLRLSDGGHNENLGLYSLIERGTRRIVVVDAEHDPHYEFESLKRIRANLKENFGIELHCASTDGTSACPLVGDYIQRRGNGVFEMTATGFPWNEPSTIVYVKLSIDESLLAENLADESGRACLSSFARLPATAPTYPCNVARYYDAEAGGNNAFPHNSTADIWYSEAQYEAYRDLAYFIGKTQLLPKVARWKAAIEAERDQARAMVRAQYLGKSVARDVSQD